MLPLLIIYTVLLSHLHELKQLFWLYRLKKNLKADKFTSTLKRLQKMYIYIKKDCFKTHKDTEKSVFSNQPSSIQLASGLKRWWMLY